MNRLPTEIVIEITTNLSFKEKELARVCKQLHRPISENSLYSKLAFTDTLKFDQAMDLHDKLDFGQQVRDLCVANMDYNVQLLLPLPGLFPRVRFSQLKSGQFELDGINTHVLKAVLLKWRYVESIVDSSQLMHLSL